MPELFETTTINGLSIKNRFVRSATWEGMAEEDGRCTPNIINMVEELVEGGVGLIISGHAYVRKNGQSTPWQLAINEDRFIAGLQEMTEAVHQKGGKIVVQLNHGGIFAHTELTGEIPYGPSDIGGIKTYDMKRRAYQEIPYAPKKISQQDIEDLVEDFGRAADRSKQAGFDGIQLHGGHGYLISQFFSPIYNQRTDHYGGSIENRTRFVLEVLGSIRMQVGDDFPVMIKMNSQDYVEGGLALKDALKAARMMEAEGMDAIEITGGDQIVAGIYSVKTGILSEKDEAYFKDDALAFREHVKIPLMLVGGIRSYHIAEQIINDQIADYISLCRPLIKEPHLINRWKSGDHGKATCLSDNKCYGAAYRGEGVCCATEKKLKERKLKKSGQ
ncbi:NADH:flavin oxidoreductase [Thermodesulfobacteriota bacterium]